MTTPPATTCTDCGSRLGGILWFFDKNHHACANCADAHLCTLCHGKNVLLMPAAANKEADAKHKYGTPLSETVIKQFCRKCYETTSTLDFSNTYHRIEGTSSSTATFVFAHGGSSSRQMFHHHAVALKEQFGYSSILLDLPGHGSLRNETEELTPESATKTVVKVLTECGVISGPSQGNVGCYRSDRRQEDGTYKKANGANHKLIYVGGSLGAYLGFHILDQLAAVFDGAVMMDCGQNVGPGASLKARIGLMVLAYIGRKWSNAKLMGLMVGETKKSKADYYLVESCFGAGMFFEQAGGQVECLKAVAPADYIPKYTFPVLYMNGSEDYRDSEDKWLELCTQKETSELKVYDGGDHFFMFDSRFVDDVLTRMGALVKTIS